MCLEAESSTRGHRRELELMCKALNVDASWHRYRARRRALLSPQIGGACTWIAPPSIQPLAGSGDGLKRCAGRTCSTLHAVGGGSHATHPHRAPAFPPVIAIARVESVDPSVTVCRYDDLHGLHGAGATAGAEESTAARVEEAVAAGTARAVRPQLLRRVDLGRGLHRTTVCSSVSDVRARRARMGRACARHGMLRARRQHVHRRHCRAHAGAVCV